jgi:hypothetical protein
MNGFGWTRLRDAKSSTICLPRYRSSADSLSREKGLVKTVERHLLAVLLVDTGFDMHPAKSLKQEHRHPNISRK